MGYMVLRAKWAPEEHSVFCGATLSTLLLHAPKHYTKLPPDRLDVATAGAPDSHLQAIRSTVLMLAKVQLRLPASSSSSRAASEGGRRLVFATRRQHRLCWAQRQNWSWPPPQCACLALQAKGAISSSEPMVLELQLKLIVNTHRPNSV